MGGLSGYEQRALKQVEDHRRRQLARSPRRLVPGRARTAVARRAEAVERKVRASPAGDRALIWAGRAYQRAAQGLHRGTSRLAQATLSERRILRAYRRHGHAADDLAAIGALDLQIIDRVRPKRLDIAYAAAAAVEGALAGGVISGGEALAAAGTVFGAGAAEAPGLGAIATAMGADAVFVLAAGSRAAAHTAMYYGYDPAEPGEAFFIMSVLNLGTATTAGAKYAAYRELSQLAQQLARRKTWPVLQEHVLTKVLQKFATDMGARLTQKKLGQFVPVAGIFVGAGLNYHMLDAICESAQWAYRERFLHDKRDDGSSFSLPEPPPSEPGSGAGEQEQPVSVLDALSELADGVEFDAGEDTNE